MKNNMIHIGLGRASFFKRDRNWKSDMHEAPAKMACMEGKLLSGIWEIKGRKEETSSGRGRNGSTEFKNRQTIIAKTTGQNNSRARILYWSFFRKIQRNQSTTRKKANTKSSLSANDLISETWIIESGLIQFRRLFKRETSKFWRISNIENTIKENFEHCIQKNMKTKKVRKKA